MSGRAPGLAGLPARLGRFEPRALLRQGPDGRVVEAWDGELRRAVALALYELPGEEGRFYFHRQARALAALDHPNVLRVFEYSGRDAPLPYLVCELLRGPQLEALLERHPAGLPAPVVLAVAADLGRALAHAHERGVVHREVKPANLFVEEQGQLVLAEFGIARAWRDAQQLGGTTIRERTALLGSPAFMAPEQIEGQPATPASDLFAAGSTLYCLATGRPPFGGESVDTLLDRLGRVDLLLPRSLRPSLPAALEALILGLLVRAPDKRLPDGRSLTSRALAALGQDARQVLERFASGQWSEADAAAGAGAAITASLPLSDAGRSRATNGGSGAGAHLPGPPPDTTAAPPAQPADAGLASADTRSLRISAPPSPRQGAPVATPQEERTAITPGGRPAAAARVDRPLPWPSAARPGWRAHALVASLALLVGAALGALARWWLG